MFWRNLTVAAIFVLVSGCAKAAQIDLDKSQSNHILRISGPIQNGDFEHFEQLITEPGIGMVRLASPGGLVVEALQIGNEIRKRGLTTSVLEQDQCASACSLIWLAGQQRQLSTSAKLGFHAVFNLTPSKVVSSDGNALVGAYLARMGFNDLLVAFVTQPPPDYIRWLTERDAAFLGLQVDWTSTADNSPAKEINPTLTLSQIDALLVQKPYEALIKLRFPEEYHQILLDAQKAQESGTSWTDAYRKHNFPLRHKLVAYFSDDDNIALLSLDAKKIRVVANANVTACAGFFRPSAFKDWEKAFNALTPLDYRQRYEMILVNALVRNKTFHFETYSEPGKKQFNRYIVEASRAFFSRMSRNEQGAFREKMAAGDATAVCEFDLFVMTKAVEKPVWANAYMRAYFNKM